MSLISNLRVELAGPGDVIPLYRLRRELEDWLYGKGIQQSPRGEVSRQDIARQVDTRNWHLVRHPEVGVAAAMRTLRSDPHFWGEDPTPAVYVHGLMVDRAMAGLGMGAFMLDWAARIGRNRGVDVCRLDCAETNIALRSFYRKQGFHEVGRRDFKDLFSVTLFEKNI